MDDTTQSRTSDVSASAATRKRRSSILKSQRPRRTPFCELEFNACTPSDTSKSRRVSFSKRTGVAEFVTNEATTTWKNFYEEQNKSLESSGHDSGPNGKQPVAHLGKQIFDQQFEEMEAVDFIGTLNPGINISSSINNINFAQLECTEAKLTFPQGNFELSALTETQSKLFHDNLAITTSEVSGRIDVNFSATQEIGEKDDLDEIQKDLQRHTDIVCQGPFTGHNLSEYIEVDLNITNVAITNDESDMSITDTIHLPKVQDVSKSCSFDKKISSNKDWVADKENIVLNPYVAPRESINFAITEVHDEVLVFDGKRLIVQVENPQKENYRQSVLPKQSERVPQRKTIVLNCNDDLPNFFEEAQVSKNQSNLGISDMQQSRILEDKPALYRLGLDEGRKKRETIIFDDGLDDISVTRAVPNVIADTEKQQTIVYDDLLGNISITQALPSNIVDKEKNRTYVSENDSANISITQAVPANVIIPNVNEKRKTIVFENEACNISMTQVIPTNIIPENTARQTILEVGTVNLLTSQSFIINKSNSKELRRTLVLEDNTNLLSSQSFIINKSDSKESRRTLVLEDNTAKNLVTHPKASSNSDENLPMPERKTTDVFKSEISNLSVTQTLPPNILLPQKLNVTCSNNTNISMTQALPTNILFQNIEPNRRRTVVFEDDTGNLSITQAVTKNQVIQGLQNIVKEQVATNRQSHLKNVSIYNESTVLNSNDKDISNAQAPINQVHNSNDKDISNAQTPINQVHNQENRSIPTEKLENKRRTIVFQNDAADISITQAVPARQVIDNIIAQNQKVNYAYINEALDKDNNSTKIRASSFKNYAPLSSIQQIPVNRAEDMVNQMKYESYSNQITKPSKSISSISKKSINEDVDWIKKQNFEIETTNVKHKEESTNRRTTKVFENEDADISMTQAVPMNKVINMMQEANQNYDAINASLLKKETSNKRRTVVFENENADISMTQAVPMNQIFETTKKNNLNIDSSAILHKEEPKGREISVVIENNETDKATAQAAPMKDVDIVQQESQIIDAINITEYEEIRNKRRTQIDKDKADISMYQAARPNQIFHREKDDSTHVVAPIEYETVKNQSIHYDDATNHKSPCIVYDDDGEDISMRCAISSTKMLPERQEKTKTIVVEDVESLLENKEFFMEIDRLTDGINKNSSKLSDADDSDMSMSDWKDSDKQVMEYGTSDVRVTKAIRKKISPKRQGKSCLEKTKVMAFNKKQVLKPIPSAMDALQLGTIDKSQCKDLTKHKSDVSNVRSDVLVYQSLTSTTQNLVNTEIRNSEITYQEEKVANEEKYSLKSLKINTEVKNPEHKPSDEQCEPKNESVAVKTSEPVDSKQNSILNDLLDMSQSSFEGTGDKELLAETTCVQELPANVNDCDTKNSVDTMFYITKDSDEERPTSETNSNIQEMGQIQGESPLNITYKDDNDPLIKRNIQAKLSTLKSIMREENPQSKHNQSNLEEETGSKVSLDMSKRRSAKSFKMANDTNELLDMLSDFTDPEMPRNLPAEKLKENVLESRQSLENKVELNKPELSRFSLPKRQSRILSREDMLNNMSMASAILQKSRSDFDESTFIDEVKETPPILKDTKKSLTMSTDVVKMLQFNDDTISEQSISIQTPLKKTAFGEISYMKETKSKVIPGFMYNPSDGVKELMDDLVKPMFNSQPFKELANSPQKNIKKKPSTCSNQIQANLLTSSQIDIHGELYSTTDSVCELNKFSSADLIVDAVNRSVSRVVKSPEQSTPGLVRCGKSSELDDKVAKSEETEGNSKTTSSRPLGSVLLFDHYNPLNNVLLVPTPAHAMDIHRYDPIKPTQESETQSSLNEETEQEEVRTTNQYHVQVSPLDNHEHKVKSNTQSVTSNTSRPEPKDQYTELQHNVKDSEINTVIAMKGNEELLEANSSLTLVEDEITRKNYSHEHKYNRDNANSPIKVIYLVDEPPTTKATMDSDFPSTDETERPTKSKKRAYSPTKHKSCTLSNLEVTPKPASKMQKRPPNPDYGELNELAANRDESPEPVKGGKSPPRQKSPRKLGKKSGTTVTVHQLMTMVHVESTQEENENEFEQEQECTDEMYSTTDPRSACDSREYLASAVSSDVMSSFTSSNNLRAESGRLSVTENPSKASWLPTTTSFSAVSSEETSDDIVGSIDAMPFMGSEDCQWESVSASQWSLLLLHSRLRLTVRFAPAPRLRADTPVIETELETLNQDKKNPIAYLCVSFAAATMRYHMSRGCARAGDARRLVRRLGGAARLAARWARAMHDARARLAYSLTHDGWLTLKVANTSYRAVWEVSMRLEQVVESEARAPWPRAGGVRAARALPAAGGARAPDLAPALAGTPADWGHAPRTIWRVFRYLKNKKRDDVAILHL